MGSLGALGIGLSVVFVGFLLLLLAELYYLLCWKKRRHHLTGRPHRINSISHEAALLANGSSEMEELEEVNVIANHHQACQTELVSKLFPDAEISHYLGPPRFLFTILEETKEELESETAARSRNGSRDFVVHSGLFSEPGTPYETPFATPPSSPSFFLTPPGTPLPSCDCLLAPKALPREPPAQISSAFPCSPRHHHHRHSQHHPCSRTTMMMMLLSNASPPVTPPATPPNGTSPLFYRTPPTHLSYFSPSPPLYNRSHHGSRSNSKGISRKH